MNDDPVKLTVFGTPRPQGSKRYVGNGIMIDADKHLKDWRYDVTMASREAMQARLPLDGPIHLMATFYLQRPKSTPKKVLYPWRKPDVDKLARGLLDALVAGGVLSDDARVVTLWADKRFAGDLNGLPIPGVTVTVQPL